MKPFLLTINSAQVAMPDLLQFLDSRLEIRNWHTPYPWTVLIIAAQGQTAATLASIVRGRFPGAQFVIADIAPNSADGWLPKAFWNLISDPKPSERWNSILASLGNAPPKP
jgi:hypothetical protein